MWNVYTTMYRARVMRLPSITGSQAWATATSTIARYFTLSKYASRRLAGAGAPARSWAGLEVAAGVRSTVRTCSCLGSDSRLSGVNGAL